MQVSDFDADRADVNQQALGRMAATGAAHFADILPIDRDDPRSEGGTTRPFTLLLRSMCRDGLVFTVGFTTANLPAWTPFASANMAAQTHFRPPLYVKMRLEEDWKPSAPKNQGRTTEGSSSTCVCMPGTTAFTFRMDSRR